jgi:hypothetical protein
LPSKRPPHIDAIRTTKAATQNASAKAADAT